MLLIYSERSGRNLSYRTFIWLLIRTFFRTWKDFENTTHATVARDAVYSSDLLSMIYIHGYMSHFHESFSLISVRKWTLENYRGLRVNHRCLYIHKILVSQLHFLVWFIVFRNIRFFRNYKNFQRDLGINFHVYFYKIWKNLKNWQFIWHWTSWFWKVHLV